MQRDRTALARCERRRAYEQQPEVRERRREYRQQPEVNARKREYLRVYRQRPEIKEHRREYQRRRTARAVVTCAVCGRTAPPAEMGGILICMWCGSTKVTLCTGLDPAASRENPAIAELGS